MAGAAFSGGSHCPIARRRGLRIRVVFPCLLHAGKRCETYAPRYASRLALEIYLPEVVRCPFGFAGTELPRRKELGMGAARSAISGDAQFGIELPRSQVYCLACLFRSGWCASRARNKDTSVAFYGLVMSPVLVFVVRAGCEHVAVDRGSCLSRYGRYN